MPSAPSTRFPELGLIAALAMIRNTVNPLEVREQLFYKNGDMERQVSLELGPDFLSSALGENLPEMHETTDISRSGNSDAAPTTSAAALRGITVPVLISTPRKGRLRSITNLADDNGDEVRLLSHSEHEWVAMALLSSLLFEAFRPWWTTDAGAREVLAKHSTRLSSCVTQPEPVATGLLDDVFDANGQVRGAPAALSNPDLVKDLHETAKMLCARYLLLAHMTCVPNHRNRLTYTHLRSYDERRFHWVDKLKSYVGGRPSFVRVESTWARRTDSFHATYEVPDGHYAYRAYAATRPADDNSKQMSKSRKITRLPERAGRPNANTSTCAVSPSVSKPHLLIADGASSGGDPINVVFLTQERPLGSAGSTLLTTLLTATLATLLSVVGFNASLANVTSPAVILALIAAIGTFAGASVGRSNDGTSVLSKVLGFANVTLALTFSWVWSALQSQQRGTDTPNVEDSNGWLSVGLVVALWVVCGAAAWRTRAAIHNFEKAVSRGN